MSAQEARSGLWYKWTETEGYADQMDANWRVIGFLLRPAVISRGLTVLPATPSDGDAYIVAATGTTGDLVGKEKNIIFWSAPENAWTHITPKNGQEVVVVSEGTWGTKTVFKGSWSPGVALG